MKLRVLVLVLVAITLGQADDLETEFTEDKIPRNDTARISLSAVPVSDFGTDFVDSIKFVGYIYGDGGYYANIIIINKYYSVTPGDLAADIGTPVPIDIYAVGNCDAYEACSNTNFDIVKVKQIIPYPDATGCPKLIDCISLVRTCPAWSDSLYGVPFASSLSPYYRTPGDSIAYIQYDFDTKAGALVGTIKNIAEYCECMDITGLFLEKHVCAAEHPANFGTTDDNISGLIVVKFDVSNGPAVASEIVGFLVRIQDSTSAEGPAELILNLGHSDYTDWYTIDANPTLHEYPL